MARAKVTLDHAGIAAILKSDPIASAVHAAAEQVAARVRQHPSIVRNTEAGDVVVDDYVTDRAASSVTVAHPAGLAIEAKYGALKQAAGGN